MLLDTIAQRRAERLTIVPPRRAGRRGAGPARPEPRACCGRGAPRAARRHRQLVGAPRACAAPRRVPPDARRRRAARSPRPRLVPAKSETFLIRPNNGSLLRRQPQPPRAARPIHALTRAAGSDVRGMLRVGEGSGGEVYIGHDERWGRQEPRALPSSAPPVPQSSCLFSSPKCGRHVCSYV